MMNNLWYFLVILFNNHKIHSLVWNSFLQNMKMMSSNNNNIKSTIKTIDNSMLPNWDILKSSVYSTNTGIKLQSELELREKGEGLPHTNAKIRLFNTKEEPRVTYFRDSAAWCPYCQKVWILLEEKKIPYKVEKINMRSYGDKPAEFLRMVPNGLLPAIKLDNQIQTESLQIMLNLERTFQGSKYKKMWPNESDKEELARATQLMRLERELFSTWCSLVFRPSIGNTNGNKKYFETCMDEVNRELSVINDGPWFLSYLSIVDLTFITHIERMCASVAYWSGFKIRGDGRWPALERWMDAFESLPSYMATKSDYYTHIKDIPPQYGPGYFMPDADKISKFIDGTAGNWMLPLLPLTSNDIEPISSMINPGDQVAKEEAADSIVSNYDAIIKFSLRGAGTTGKKQFQAPLADPYAIPDLNYYEDVESCLKIVVKALLEGNENIDKLSFINNDEGVKLKIIVSLNYLKERIGVPRDMSYPAARQLRAHLNWLIKEIQ